jgi:hypothetical protein
MIEDQIKITLLKKMILDQDQIIYFALFEGHFLNFLIKHF